MRTFARAVLPALVLALALAPVADANMMYSYVGDTFKTVPGITGLISGVYTTQDRITGWLIVADGFTPAFGAWYQDLTPGVVHYSFTDGHQTLTEANSTAWFRLAVLNPADVAFCPLLRCWNVGVTTPGGGIVSSMDTDRQDSARLGLESWAGNGAGFLTDGSHPGTWTAQTVPEPATLVLLAGALLGVGAVAWRQRRTMAP